MFRLKQVIKRFPGAARPAVDELSLVIPRRSFTVLLGASGSGKTTALKLLNRLHEKTSGVIEFDGRSVEDCPPTELRRRCGYVIQGIGLFPHLRVAENIAVVPQLLGWSRAAQDERTDELLELMQLPADEFSQRYPAELSGGQQQRVGVARALAARPDVLLMDEPFGALDPVTRAALQTELKRLHAQLELTIVMVTHDVSEALLLADQIAVLDAGRLVAALAPADLLASQLPAVRALLDIPRRQAAVLHPPAAESS